MGWPVSFIRALASSQIEAIFRAVCLNGPRSSYITTPTFAELPGPGIPAADVIMGADGPEVSSESLQIPDVSCSHGEWSFRAVTQNSSRVIQAARRGRLMALEMSLDGGGAWEPVALGAVSRRTITRDGLGTGLEIGCTGLGALLSQRYAAAAENKSLFRETRTGAVLGAAYTAHDTTVTVDSTAAWAEFDGDSIYYLRVYPSDGSASFILKATGRTGTTFTGVGVAAVWDTTEVDSLAGSVVGVQRGTRLGASYTAGDTTVTVDSTAAWAGLDADGVYYFGIYATSNGLVYLRATGRTATTFTGVTGGRLGTTDHNASTHDEVQLLRVVQGHPIECALKVMQSTGLGTNGPWDTLPADWGLALPRSIVDDTFSRLSITDSTPSSGSTLFEILVDDEEDVQDPGDWMRTWLAPFGGLITLRQGQIVARVLRDPSKVGGKTVMAFTDDNTVDGPYGDLEAADQAVAYLEVVHHAQGVRQYSAEDVLTGPVADSVEVELPHLFTNLSNALSEVSQRMAPYYHRTPADLTLSVATLEGAQLAPGDFAYLSSSWVELPADSSGRSTCEGRGALIGTVTPALTGASVEVQLYLYPDGPGL